MLCNGLRQTREDLSTDLSAIAANIVADHAAQRVDMRVRDFDDAIIIIFSRFVSVRPDRSAVQKK
ncbi:MAG: hypothetical protein GKS00_12825 [Alphaproteobacteria bacterium]|nr:hypothetical protein [Alphaproteobacteria bacterium]